MEITSLRNFINNAEPLTINTIINKEALKIECTHGNAVLLSEQDFLKLINSRENLEFISKK